MALPPQLRGVAVPMARLLPLPALLVHAPDRISPVTPTPLRLPSTGIAGRPARFARRAAGVAPSCVQGTR